MRSFMAALALPRGGESLGLSLFWARAVGVEAAFILLYPVVVAREEPGVLGWTAAAVVGCWSRLSSEASH